MQMEFNQVSFERDLGYCSLTTVAFVGQRHLGHLCVGDVLVRRQEQHHLPLFIFDRHNVEEAPERSACLKEICRKYKKLKS